jgi:RNA polymerase sigma-70 factor (ECF subfamily)
VKDTDNKYVQGLIEDSRNGNKHSFKQLIDLYIGPIYLFCYRMVVNEKLSEAITKQVFIMAWKNLKQIRDDSSFANWLTGFTVYQIIQYIRKNNSSFKDLKTKKVSNAAKISDPSLSSFERLIFHLDEDERILFLLHDIKKYSYDEIADLFTFCSAGEVLLIVKQAREKLAKGLLNELQ